MFDAHSIADYRAGALLCAVVCGLASAATAVVPFLLIQA